MILSAMDGRITLRRGAGRPQRLPDGDPLEALRGLLADFQPVAVPGLPRFQGGAVGYVSYSGSLYSCITIRTIVCHGRRASMQVGAGIVADSDPKTEWLEMCSEVRGLVLALRMAATSGRS